MGFELTASCIKCGAPCSREGGKCRTCFRSGPKRVHGTRKVYPDHVKLEALAYTREHGTKAASRRFGIPVATLRDWKYATQAMAYSSSVQPDTPTERKLLLAQLTHEQELEMRYEARQRYRHDRKRSGSVSLDEPLEPRPGSSINRYEWVALGGQGSYVKVAQRHLIEWLDPTFDEVAA